MNQKRAKELLPVIKAFAEGKIIQTKLNDDWLDESNPCWFADHKYRIKPEEKVVPYTSDEEFYNDWCTKKPYLVSKESGIKYFLQALAQNGVLLGNDIRWTNWRNVFEYFKFADGTPCGKVADDYV